MYTCILRAGLVRSILVYDPEAGTTESSRVQWLSRKRKTKEGSAGILRQRNDEETY